ncbi:AfsR/SARP family transcriptional regulator [Nonomuraea sp. NPDC003201]
MEFRVLGPLEVRAGDGRAVALGGARPRAVLARLLVARGTVVSSDALIDDLYAGAPPPSALPTLHSYVSNLRRAELRPPVEALACLDEALGLWRGTPYGEFAEEPWAVTEVSRLRELRLVALERRANVLLELGRAQAVITDLETEAVANPLRERPPHRPRTAGRRRGPALVARPRRRHPRAPSRGHRWMTGAAWPAGRPITRQPLSVSSAARGPAPRSTSARPARVTSRARR